MCKKTDCAYFARSTRTCDFRLITGKGRGCDAQDCIHYIKGLRSEMKMYDGNEWAFRYSSKSTGPVENKHYNER